MSDLEENIKPNEEEIDLAELVKSIWASRMLIIKVTMVFALLGLFVALASKVEYKSSCKLMPESQESAGNLGGLGGLAGLAGINLDFGGGASISPQLYPQVVNSVPFQQSILYKKVYYQSLDSTITTYDYFNDVFTPSVLGYVVQYTLGLPGIIKSLFRSPEKANGKVMNSDLVWISLEDTDLIEMFADRISVDYELETGIVTIEVEMPDAYASAAITDAVVHELTDRITKYKIEKVQNNLEFINERLIESKNAFDLSQKRLAQFIDNNKNIVSALAGIQNKRLENEYNIAFEVYKSLASQLEQAKIKVKEETPVFTVLEPVRIPVEKSSPRRALILVGLSFLGGFLAVGYVFMRNTFIK